jgi:predicted DNA-binding protein
LAPWEVARITEPDPRELAEAQKAAEEFASGNITFDHSTQVDDQDVPPADLTEQPSMVVTSLRMPLDLYLRIKAAADRRGTTMAALLRGWAELELATEEDDRPISRHEALRALTSVPPLRAA